MQGANDLTERIDPSFGELTAGMGAGGGEREKRIVMAGDTDLFSLAFHRGHAIVFPWQQVGVRCQQVPLEFLSAH
jgi:hypothetical protein